VIWALAPAEGWKGPPRQNAIRCSRHRGLSNWIAWPVCHRRSGCWRARIRGSRGRPYRISRFPALTGNPTCNKRLETRSSDRYFPTPCTLRLSGVYCTTSKALSSGSAGEMRGIGRASCQPACRAPGSPATSDSGVMPRRCRSPRQGYEPLVFRFGLRRQHDVLPVIHCKEDRPIHREGFPQAQKIA